MIGEDLQLWSTEREYVEVDGEGLVVEFDWHPSLTRPIINEVEMGDGTVLRDVPSELKEKVLEVLERRRTDDA